MNILLRRREFIAGLGGAAASPLAVRAQQSAMPVVGVLFGGKAQADGPGTPALVGKALSETGFVEGKNVEILRLGAEWQYDRLPALAAELVRRRVAVIFALWNAPALAAKSATETLPVVFAVGGDPVELGLVARLNRPDGNVTGVYNLGTTLLQKRLQLLHEIVPAARTVGFLINPTSRQKDFDLREVETAARILGITMVTLSATTPGEIETAIIALGREPGGGLVVMPDVFMGTHRVPIISAAAREQRTGGLYAI